MDSRSLIKKYLDFFVRKGHSKIPSAPLIPENDSSILFTTAGMHPLVPYLLGEKHPLGTRLTNVQTCVRTVDIDNVGDEVHHTFFEMLGNWSLGDYWKKESITWSLEFLTKVLGLSLDKLVVTCFEGDKNVARDTETAEIWRSLNIPKERIFFLPKSDNWWGPAGETGPCGPDTEIFFDTGKLCGDSCYPGDESGRFVEIWNNVFLEYNQNKDGSLTKLTTKNVDTGMGVDRTTAILNGLPDDYLVEDLWGKIIDCVRAVSGKDYGDNKKAFRIIADHLRASVFIAAEGIIPGNKERDYILRRLIRRTIRYGRNLGIRNKFLEKVASAAIDNYSLYYPILAEKKNNILETLSLEEDRFSKTLEKGLGEIEKIEKLDGKKAFWLYETYGFPVELTEEIAKDRGQKIDKAVFEKEFLKHKKLSQSASAGMFKGGLMDASEEVIKFHTATHLLHQSLRKVLGEEVSQKGSNITPERLRFDFSWNEKLTPKQITLIEKIINEQIIKDLPVTFEMKTLAEAKKDGALAFFADKYGQKVKVYTVGDPLENWFSKEVCGGPHVSRTGEIGHVRIIKQEKLGAGTLRIYATNKK